MSKPVGTEGTGILHCCGKGLRWRREKGSAVFEASCGNSGTNYAMDRGCDHFEIDAEDSSESRPKFLRIAS